MARLAFVMSPTKESRSNTPTAFSSPRTGRKFSPPSITIPEIITSPFTNHRESLFPHIQHTEQCHLSHSSDDVYDGDFDVILSEIKKDSKTSLGGTSIDWNDQQSISSTGSSFTSSSISSSSTVIAPYCRTPSTSPSNRRQSQMNSHYIISDSKPTSFSPLKPAIPHMPSAPLSARGASEDAQVTQGWHIGTSDAETEICKRIIEHVNT